MLWVQLCGYVFGHFGRGEGGGGVTSCEAI